MPNAEVDVLRFQIGEMELRNEVWPVYGEGNGSVGYRTVQHKSSFFHLYGFGSTLALAEARVRELFPSYGRATVMPPAATVSVVATPAAVPSDPPELQARIDLYVQPPAPVERINLDISPPNSGSETN